MPTQAQFKDAMFQAAEEGRKILVRHFGRLKSIEKKGEIDLVTIADKQAEAAILKTIRRAFPEHSFLCEESGATSCSEGCEYCWVIDPLDGTTNFAHNMPIFAISIGLQKNHQTIMGLIVDVMRDEWFFAQRGKGAFLNGKRIRVSKAPTLIESLVITGFPHVRRQNVAHLMKIVGAALMETQGVLRLGSAALDLCSVAAGRAEAFWEEHLHAWDVAAGLLLVEEAGGRCSKFNGEDCDILGDQFLATNGAIHEELRTMINDHWTEW